MLQFSADLIECKKLMLAMSRSLLDMCNMAEGLTPVKWQVSLAPGCWGTGRVKRQEDAPGQHFFLHNFTNIFNCNPDISVYSAAVINAYRTRKCLTIVYLIALHGTSILITGLCTEIPIVRVSGRLLQEPYTDSLQTDHLMISF